MGKGKRITTEEAVACFLKADLKVVGEYKGSRDKTKCICTKCNTTVYPRLHNIRSGGGGCAKCAGRRKFSDETRKPYPRPTVPRFRTPEQMIALGTDGGSNCPAELVEEFVPNLLNGHRGSGLGELGRGKYTTVAELREVVVHNPSLPKGTTHLKASHSAKDEPTVRWTVARLRGSRYRILFDGEEIVSDLSFDLAASLVVGLQKNETPLAIPTKPWNTGSGIRQRMVRMTKEERRQATVIKVTDLIEGPGVYKVTGKIVSISTKVRVHCLARKHSRKIDPKAKQKTGCPSCLYIGN